MSSRLLLCLLLIVLVVSALWGWRMFLSGDGERSHLPRGEHASPPPRETCQIILGSLQSDAPPLAEETFGDFCGSTDDQPLWRVRSARCVVHGAPLVVLLQLGDATTRALGCGSGHRVSTPFVPPLDVAPTQRIGLVLPKDIPVQYLSLVLSSQEDSGVDDTSCADAQGAHAMPSSTVHDRWLTMGCSPCVSCSARGTFYGIHMRSPVGLGNLGTGVALPTI